MTTVYGDLVRYRELFGNLFRRDVQAKYRGSLLGVAWTLANPILLMAVYLLVFSVLWKTGFGSGGHYALFLLVGLSAWIFFATSVQSASRSMLDNANLIRKTRFPRQLVPLSVVATHLISFVVMLVVLLVVNFALLPRVRATEWLALPLGLAIVALVGYTNAGKSTLLNSLVGSEVAKAEDKLFATLDPTSRQVKLGDGQTAIVRERCSLKPDSARGSSGSSNVGANA